MAFSFSSSNCESVESLMIYLATCELDKQKINTMVFFLGGGDQNSVEKCIILIAQNVAKRRQSIAVIVSLV
jgi:hypothetical protein